MASFATIDDLTALWRPMTEDEQERASVLLNIVSDSLRYEANKVDRDLDLMIMENPYLASVAKSVTCDVTARVLMTSTDQEPMSQMSQAAGGYSVSGTFLVPSGGLFIKKSELARLGLKKQRTLWREFYGSDQRNDGPAI